MSLSPTSPRRNGALPANRGILNLNTSSLQNAYAFVFTFRGEMTYAAVKIDGEWYAKRVVLVRSGVNSIRIIEVGSITRLGLAGDVDGEVVYDPRRMVRQYVLRIVDKVYRGLSPEEVAEKYAEDHPDVDKDLLGAFLGVFFELVKRTKGETRGGGA